MERNRYRRGSRVVVIAAAAAIMALPGVASAQSDSDPPTGIELNAGYATWWGLWHLGTVEAHGWLPGLPNVTGRVFHGYRQATNLGCSFEALDCKAWWSATGIMGGLRWSAGHRIRPFLSLQAGALTFESSAGRSAGPIVGAFAGLETRVSGSVAAYIEGAGLLGGGVPIPSVGAGLAFRMPW